MKLIDLLEVIDDNQDVIITDANNNEIAKYDGNDSIPDRYNNDRIISVSEYKHQIRIQIKRIVL